MAGKGSKQRPTNLNKYEANWDRIFGDKSRNLAYESDNPLERPYNPPSMWEHFCKHEGHISIETGHACNWCGMEEDS